MSALDELFHLPIEKGEQQSSDVGAVDVGVGHNDDFVVAKLVDVEPIGFIGGPGSDSASNRRNEGANFLVGQHLRDSRFFHVDNFPAQRQNRLKATVSSLFGRAAG